MKQFVTFVKRISRKGKKTAENGTRITQIQWIYTDIVLRSEKNP